WPKVTLSTVVRETPVLGAEFVHWDLRRGGIENERRTKVKGTVLSRNDHRAHNHTVVAMSFVGVVLQSSRISDPALGAFGVEPRELPLSPPAVWRLIEGGRKKAIVQDPFSLIAFVRAIQPPSPPIDGPHDLAIGER